MPSASISLRVNRHVLHHDGDGVAPLLGRAQVLGLAVVGLQPGEAQGRVLADLLRQRDRRLAGRHAAAALADVDFDEHVDHGVAALLAAHVVHRQRQARDAFDAVHRDGQLAVLGRDPVRQRRDTRQLGGGDHFVADVHVADAARDHGFGLGGLLHAHAHGAGLHLQPGERGALVHLGVRPPAHAVLARELGHAREVALHRVQVDDQRGRVDGADALADQAARNASEAGVFVGGFMVQVLRCRTSPPA